MKQVGIEMQRIAAQIIPTTINDEDQTVEIVWSTGSRVLRWDWDIGYYWEELSMDPAHVILDRMNSGVVNFLDAHDGRSMDSVLGTMMKGWIKDGEGRGILKFSVKDRAQELLADYKRGVGITNSVGYNPYKMELIEKSENDYPVYRVVLWEVMEISGAPVPADPKSAARTNDKALKVQCEIIDNLTKKRGPEMEKPNDGTTKVDPTPQTDNKTQETGVEVERARVLAIGTQVRKHGDKLPKDFEERMIKEGKTVDEVNSFIIDHLAESQRTIKPTNDVQVGDQTGFDAAKRGIENALEVRTGIKSAKDLTNEGRDFSGQSIVRMAEDYLRARGVNIRGMNSMKLATRALHSDSDFPLLLSNLAGKHLLKGAESVEQDWRDLVSEISVTDFKDINGINLGSVNSFKEVKPGDEFEATTISENGEKYRVKTFGTLLLFTRQMMMNDDLRALTSAPNKLGAAGARTENELFYSFFESPHTMADNKQLFDSSHNNLDSNTGIDNAALTKLMQLIELQKDGKAPLNLHGKYILASVTYRTQLQQLLSAINATKAADVNIHAGLYKLILSPYLTAGKIFGATDKAQYDLIEAAYINGQKSTYLEEEIDFKTDGIGLKARIDVGMKPMAHKGLSKVTIS